MPPQSTSFGLLTGSVVLLSLVQFRALGGRLRVWAPSDIIRPGSFAGPSMGFAAPGNEYADAAMKRRLWLEGVKRGCHSCGRSRSWWGVGKPLPFIGDHIPPNKYAKLADAVSGAADTGPKPWWQVLLPFLRPRKTPQVFLPQCERCSQMQSHAVRLDRRTLVAPRSWRWYDLWMPWPMLLAMAALPLMEELRERWRQDRRSRERSETWLQAWKDFWGDEFD